MFQTVLTIFELNIGLCNFQCFASFVQLNAVRIIFIYFIIQNLNTNFYKIFWYKLLKNFNNRLNFVFSHLFIRCFFIFAISFPHIVRISLNFYTKSTNVIKI